MKINTTLSIASSAVHTMNFIAARGNRFRKVGSVYRLAVDEGLQAELFKLKILQCEMLILFRKVRTPSEFRPSKKVS